MLIFMSYNTVECKICILIYDNPSLKIRQLFVNRVYQTCKNLCEIALTYPTPLTISVGHSVL